MRPVPASIRLRTGGGDVLDLNQAWTALRDVGMTLVVIVLAVIVIEVDHRT